MQTLQELAQSARDTKIVVANAKRASYGFLGYGQYGRCCQRIAGGFHENREIARDLATMEAVERYCLEHYRANSASSIRDLKRKNINYLGFDVLAPLSKHQLEKANLEKITDRQQIDWFIAKDYAGQEVYLPSELIFYGCETPSKFYMATSSGAAARGSIKEAIITGAEELIERDALMRTWLYRRAPKKLNDDSLPEWVLRVKKKLHRANRDLIVFDLTEDSFSQVPVFLAIIVSQKYPFFVTGSAAGFGHYANTIKKAVTEANHSLSYWINMKAGWRWDKYSPNFHGAYYAEEKRPDINWLFEGTNSKNIWTEFDYDATNRVLRALRMVYADISLNTFPAIKVAKVFSPLLVPISFGTGMVHYKKAARYNMLSLLTPHCFM